MSITIFVKVSVCPEDVVYPVSLLELTAHVPRILYSLFFDTRQSRRRGRDGEAPGVRVPGEESVSHRTNEDGRRPQARHESSSIHVLSKESSKSPTDRYEENLLDKKVPRDLRKSTFPYFTITVRVRLPGFRNLNTYY